MWRSRKLETKLSDQITMLVLLESQFGVRFRFSQPHHSKSKVAKHVESLTRTFHSPHLGEPSFVERWPCVGQYLTSGLFNKLVMAT